MKCSVVIPFYRELDMIKRTVSSITDNSCQDLTFEIVIGNDGQIPNSDILEALAEDDRQCVKITNNHGIKGPGGARNAALEETTGEYIAFLDADDYWLPGKIQAQLSEIEKGATFVATGYAFDDSDTYIQPPASIETANDIFLRRGIGTSTVLITRSLLGDKRFSDIRFSQDIDFWYNLAKSPLFKYTFVDQNFVIYSKGGSTGNKVTQLDYFNRMLVMNNIGGFNRLKILASYAFAGIYKHYVQHLINSIFTGNRNEQNGR